MNMKRKDYIFVRFIAFSVLYTVVSIAILLIALNVLGNPWFYIISALFVVYVSTLVLGYHLIWKPYIQKQKITIEQFNKYLDNATTLEVSKRQAQYIALQNQINPHFCTIPWRVFAAKH